MNTKNPFAPGNLLWWGSGILIGTVLAIWIGGGHTDYAPPAPTVVQQVDDGSWLEFKKQDHLPAQPVDQGELKDDPDLVFDNPRFFDVGGTKESERAVRAGLKWLASHQAADGSWSLDGMNRVGKCNCTVAGMKNDVAATSLALMCFLARGELHLRTDPYYAYTKNIDRGLKALLARQNPDGSFDGPYPMYTSALGTMALCEAYHCSGCDPPLKEPCERAMKYIVRTQHEQGGWSSRPRQPPDLSATAWQLQAVKAGSMAGIDIPAETYARARKFLKSVEYPGGNGYGYRSPSDKMRPTVVAAGILSRQYLEGGDLTKGDATRGVDLLLHKSILPSTELGQIYHYFLATQVIFNIKGKPWQTWSPKMRDLLIATQDKGETKGREHQKGSWSSDSQQYGTELGRVGVTCLSLLTLEVYYRHHPTSWPDLMIRPRTRDEKRKR